MKTSAISVSSALVYLILGAGCCSDAAAGSWSVRSALLADWACLLESAISTTWLQAELWAVGEFRYLYTAVRTHWGAHLLASTGC